MTDFSHNHVNAPTLSDDESVLPLSEVFDHSEPLIFDIKVIQETHQWEDLDASPQLGVAVFISHIPRALFTIRTSTSDFHRGQDLMIVAPKQTSAARG
jgi:hypothetical protein